MSLLDSKEKAKEQKILGDLGELAVLKLLGKEGKNLNEIKNNFPLFDLIEQDYFYTVKTRRKYTPKDKKLNGEYNIVKPNQSYQKLQSFYKAAESLNVVVDHDNLFWVAIPYEDDTWCPIYYGKLSELPNNPMTEFFKGESVYVRIKMKDKYTKNYSVLGYTKFDLEKETVEVKQRLDES